MSELRKDPILNRWVIVAPERAPLRADFPADSVEENAPCPFCPGQEHLAPNEIRAHFDDPSRAPNGPGWSLRVVPNGIPALRVEGELHRRNEGPLEALAGVGAHEVIIESPDHRADFGDLSPAQVTSVLLAWGERLRDLSQDIRLLSAFVCRNHGTVAGARLAHPHSQLVALPIVPPRLAIELASSAAWFQAHRSCGYCDVLQRELASGARVVQQSEHAVVLAPWASRVPFELMLLPRQHGASFEHAPRAVIEDVAVLLRDVVRRLAVALEKPAWMLVVHTAPLRDQRLGHYHWHIEVQPVVGHFGGFESGSGCFINPVPPEEAAAFLRRISHA